MLPCSVAAVVATAVVASSVVASAVVASANDEDGAYSLVIVCI